MTNRSIHPVVDIEALRGRLTIPLYPDAADILGISKNLAYAAAKSGEIPTLRVGIRYLVPVSPLLRMLGLSEAR